MGRVGEIQSLEEDLRLERPPDLPLDLDSDEPELDPPFDEPPLEVELLGVDDLPSDDLESAAGLASELDLLSAAALFL